MPRRVLIVGGTGAFGRRLVGGLMTTTEHEIVIAGRDLSRAQAFADEINAGSSTPRATAMRIDARSPNADEIKSVGAFLLVDAAGPFQTGDYRLARVAIAAGMHYVDLADARGFVAEFAQLDGQAKAAGVTALTGASSTPALSNAVLDRLTQGWRAVDSIEIAISPGNRAPRGLLGDGPVIPTLPALAVIRALADGRLVRPGAMACVGVLDLEAITAEFTPYRIRTWTETQTFTDAPLFARILKERFACLPKAIRDVHSPQPRLDLCGRATVEESPRQLTRLVRRLLGLPRAGEDVPVHVQIEARGEQERWRRDFAGQEFTSLLGSSDFSDRITERFGAMTCEFNLVASKEMLSMEIVGWSLGPMPLPRSLAPTINAREWVDEQGRFRFDVAIGAPVIGQIVHYRGWLLPR
jgi:hypothetical protein